MSEFIKSFKQLNSKNVNIAGGKGASLGEMTHAFSKAGQAQANPIPPGFVILANAFDRFLLETPLRQGFEGQADLDVTVQAELDKINYQD